MKSETVIAPVWANIQAPEERTRWQGPLQTCWTGQQLNSRVPSRLQQFRRDLLERLELVERILRTFPAVAPSRNLLIRTIAGEVDRAVCRAIAKALAFGETCQIEIQRTNDV